MDSIAILDFGSQYAQLIARRVREADVYCELFPWDAPESQVLEIDPKGFILSGGPASVYAPNAPQIPGYVLESGLPILGICYGMQLGCQILGAEIIAAERREYGRTKLARKARAMAGTTRYFSVENVSLASREITNRAIAARAI